MHVAKHRSWVQLLSTIGAALIVVWTGVILWQGYVYREAALKQAVEFSLSMAAFSVVLVPTRTGTTARMISRFKPSEWIVAVSQESSVAQGLQFSYGVLPLLLEREPESWGTFI